LLLVGSVGMALQGSEKEFGIAAFAGYDTTDVISAFQPAKAAWKDDATFEEVFKAPEEAAVVVQIS